MDLPLCEDCSGRTILCPDCQKKYDAGALSPLEIQLSRLFQKISPDISFHHAIDTGEAILIIAEKKQLGGIIGKGGTNLQRLKELLGKYVKVLGEDSFEDLVHNLVLPAQVVSIKKVFDAGVEKNKVIVRGKDMLRLEPENIEEILSKTTSRDVKIEFG